MDEEFMRIALEEAKTALQAGEVPVGCCIVRENKVIAKSHNLTCETKNATTHCEINCIRALAEKESNKAKVLAGATLYVTVEPCIMCAQALIFAGVEQVVYGCDNDKFGGTGSVFQLHLQSEPAAFGIRKGVLRQEAV